MNEEQPLLHGRWRLGRRLGAGGQARTFLAEDVNEPGRVVVVKQIDLRGERTWKRFELFEREVNTLRSLRHPGIPRVLDHFEEPAGHFHLVMERAPGVTLRAMATRVRFTADELVDVARRTLDILGYLHGLSPPIVHRDVKPANIVRAADGRISLVDFGAVKNVLREEGGSTVVGTFGYMAPEQLHGGASPATDVYGLGATIVALAGGVEPEHVPRKGLRMNLERHLTQLSEGLRGWLVELTDPDPDARPADARAALVRLDVALARDKKRALAPQDGVRPTPATRPGPQPAPVRLQPAVTTPPSQRRNDDFADDEPIFAIDESNIPPPLRLVLRAAYVAIGLIGALSLKVAEVLVVPFVFALLKAFSDRNGRDRLAQTERDARRLLSDGQGGFRAMRRQGLRGARRSSLPAPPPPPRLPPRRR